MYDAVDITAPDASPAEDAARAHALFFVVYVVVGGLFVMNLFVGCPTLLRRKVLSAEVPPAQAPRLTPHTGPSRFLIDGFNLNKEQQDAASRLLTFLKIVEKAHAPPRPADAAANTLAPGRGRGRAASERTARGRGRWSRAGTRCGCRQTTCRSRRARCCTMRAL
jgi:hypothetical protein